MEKRCALRKKDILTTDLRVLLVNRIDNLHYLNRSIKSCRNK